MLLSDLDIFLLLEGRIIKVCFQASFLDIGEYAIEVIDSENTVVQFITFFINVHKQNTSSFMKSLASWMNTAVIYGIGVTIIDIFLYCVLLQQQRSSREFNLAIELLKRD